MIPNNVTTKKVLPTKWIGKDFILCNAPNVSLGSVALYRMCRVGEEVTRQRHDWQLLLHIGLTIPCSKQTEQPSWQVNKLFEWKSLYSSDAVETFDLFAWRIFQFGSNVGNRQCYKSYSHKQIERRVGVSSLCKHVRQSNQNDCNHSPPRQQTAFASLNID